jgi:FkbM family methyltransferase
MSHKIIFYNFIKKIFSLAGLSIGFKKKNLNFDEIYKNYIRNPIIFDVGANEGQSIKRFNLIFNNCIIHSFEPIKKCFDRIVEDYPSKQFIKNNYALSEKSVNKRFFINKYSATSSFDRINKNYYQPNNEKNKTVKILKVKTVTLDSYINLNKIKKIDILKIDTQGHELNVLKGAKNALQKSMINFIEAEIIICDYYENKINLFEFDRIMYENNFILFNFQEFVCDNSSQIKWFDILYVNKNFLLQRSKKQKKTKKIN